MIRFLVPIFALMVLLLPVQPGFTQNVGTRENPVPLGETGTTADGFAVRVTRVELYATGSLRNFWDFSVFPQPAQGRQYSVVTVTVGRTSGTELFVSDNLLLFDQEGYYPTTCDELLAPTNLRTFDYPYVSRVPVTGSICRTIDTANDTRTAMQYLPETGSPTFFALR